MRELIADIQKYIKQNYPKGGMVYSATPAIFEKTIVKTKKTPITKKPAPKITTTHTKKQPPVKKEEAPSPVVEVEKKPDALQIEKVQNPKRAAGADFKSFYGNFAPQFHIHEKPKSDDIAKKVKAKSIDQKALTDVVIFTNSSMSLYNRLLGNIAHAIEIKLCPCRFLDISVIEKSNRWENIFSSHKLHLIMIPESVLKGSSNLLSYYKDGKIGGVETYFLNELDEVQKNPEKKKALWKAITEMVKK